MHKDSKHIHIASTQCIFYNSVVDGNFNFLIGVRRNSSLEGTQKLPGRIEHIENDL